MLRCNNYLAVIEGVPTVNFTHALPPAGHFGAGGAEVAHFGLPTADGVLVARGSGETASDVGQCSIRTDVAAVARVSRLAAADAGLCVATR